MDPRNYLPRTAPGDAYYGGTPYPPNYNPPTVARFQPVLEPWQQFPQDWNGFPSRVTPGQTPGWKQFTQDRNGFITRTMPKPNPVIQPSPPPLPYVTTTPMLPQAYQDLLKTNVMDQKKRQGMADAGFAEYMKQTGPQSKVDMDARNAAYRASQEKVTGEMQATNKTNADQTNATIARMTAEAAKYEQGLRAATNQAIAAGAGGLNVGRALNATASGGQANNSGVNQDRMISNSSRLLLPQEAALSNRRMSQILAEQDMQNRLYGHDVAINERNSGLQQDYYGKDYAAQRQYIADLERRVAVGGQLTAQEIANVNGLMQNFRVANDVQINKPMDPSKNLNPSVPLLNSAPNRQYTPQPAQGNQPQPAQGNPVNQNPTDNQSQTGDLKANGYPLVYGQSDRHRLPRWVNEQRARAGWQMDENGDYTINRPDPRTQPAPLNYTVPNSGNYQDGGSNYGGYA